jgi:undecaprenyl-diphosphatase
MRAASVLTSGVFHALSTNDHRIMRSVHGWRAPRWIRMWMLCASRGGDGWLWYTLGAVILTFGGQQRFLAVGSATIAAALGVLLFLYLKRRIGRRRPCSIAPHCWSTLLPPDRFSFPSGHTITAFSVACSLSYYYANLAPGLLFCACSVAVSRIILGMHFLTDVLAGAMVGVVLACLSHYLLTLVVAG